MADGLIASLEFASEFDALSKLRPGEPYFVLLGRDRLAPDLVLKWAKDNRERALTEFSADKISLERRDRELRKSTEAEERAWSMREFKRGDLERRATGQPTAKFYSGHELPDETKNNDALQAARIRAAAALNGAVSEIHGVMQIIDAHFASEAELADIANVCRDMVESMRGLSEELKPSREALVKRLSQ